MAGNSPIAAGDSSVAVSFSLDFWTQYRASLILMHYMVGTWVGYVFFVGIPTVALLIGLLKGYDLTREIGFGYPAWTALLGGYAFMFVFMPLLQAWTIWNHRRNNASAKGLRTLRLSDMGMEIVGDSFDVKIKWAGIAKARETGDYIF